MKRPIETDLLEEQEAVRAAQHPEPERCGVTDCEYNHDKVCGYFAETGCYRPCGTDEACEFYYGANAASAAGKPGRYQRITDNWLELYEQGMTDREIGEAVGVPATTIQSRRKARGLPVNREKRRAKTEHPATGKAVEDTGGAECVRLRVYARLLTGEEYTLGATHIVPGDGVIWVFMNDDLVGVFQLHQVAALYIG